VSHTIKATTTTAAPISAENAVTDGCSRAKPSDAGRQPLGQTMPSSGPASCAAAAEAPASSTLGRFRGSIDRSRHGGARLRLAVEADA
jgi:hypothetical protein